MDSEIGDLFVCEDYVLEEFQFNDVTQKLYCLKSSVTDFDLTGQIIWPAAIALSKYIVENPDTFKDKNIVELGSGAGLSGFVASNYARKVVLSDNNEVVLKLLKKNIAFLEKQNVFVENIGWGEQSLEALNLENFFGNKFTKDDKIDIVMGADVIFWPESLEGLIQTLDDALTSNPDCLVLISFYSRVKYTNTRFETKLQEHKLVKDTLVNEGDLFIFQIRKEK